MTGFLLPAAGGAVLGGLYFGGLWATVRRLPDSRWPAGLALLSFVARTALTALGFAMLLGGEPARLVVALVAFVGVRVLFVRRVQRQPDLGPGGAR